MKIRHFDRLGNQTDGLFDAVVWLMKAHCLGNIHDSEGFPHEYQAFVEKRLRAVVHRPWLELPDSLESRREELRSESGLRLQVSTEFLICGELEYLAEEGFGSQEWRDYLFGSVTSLAVEFACGQDGSTVLDRPSDLTTRALAATYSDRQLRVQTIFRTITVEHPSCGVIGCWIDIFTIPNNR